MHDFGHLPNSGRKTWLRSYIPTLDAHPDFGRHHDSGHASRLRPMSVLHVLPFQLWKTPHGRARWLQHLTGQTLSQKQTGRDASLLQRSKPRHLTTSHVQVSGHVPRNQRHLAWLDLRETRVSERTRYPCNSGGSRSSNVWSGEQRLYDTWPWH
jgi:hypothetical protein